MIDLPFVTCICPTKNRSHWLHGAIDSFLSQDYQGGAELLVVDDGSDNTEELVERKQFESHHDPMREGSLLRYIRFSGNIGQKRNYACGLANGELIAHWDSDDYSLPGRLSEQVSRLVSFDKSVAGYHTMKFLDFRTNERWWKFSGRPREALGTSLVYRRDFWQTHPFLNLQIGEDGLFVAAAHSEGQLTSVDAGNHMFASIHADNTSSRFLNPPDWSRTEVPVVDSAKVIRW